MTLSRRTVLSGSLLAGATLLAKREAEAQPVPGGGATTPTPTPTTPTPMPLPPAGRPGRVVVPNGWTLPWKQQGNTKVFHLVAEPVKHVLAPGLEIEAWGYNGTTPGPLIEVTEGDRVRIYVTNKLPEITSVHWHGVFVPFGMDGVAGLTQQPIQPGKTYRYEFVLDRPGTFMYHPHADEMTQIALGMMGMIVVHPRRPETRRVRDYALFSHAWKIPIGSRRPDPLAMNDFNMLTFNSKAFPATQPLVAEVGDLVRLRFANLGPMDHHPLHIHGHAFELVATDGGTVPPSARLPETSMLVPVGTTRTVEFVAQLPGDWPLHCHMTHHVMNQMGHDTANLIGADVRGLDEKLGRAVPGYMTMGASGMSEMSHMQMEQPRNSISMVGGKGPHGVIEMGGMFTLVKIRDKLPAGGADPGWYDIPKGTMAIEATADELRRDGIDV